MTNFKSDHHYHLDDVDLLLTGRRQVDDLLHPRLVHTVQERDWGLKPHALMMIVMMISVINHYNARWR